MYIPLSVATRGVLVTVVEVPNGETRVGERLGVIYKKLTYLPTRLLDPLFNVCPEFRIITSTVHTFQEKKPLCV